MHSPTTLVATLGGQPQIVTLMLDQLIDQGVPVDYVYVVYLGGNERYKAAFRKLAAEFTGDRYQGRICRLRNSPIRLGKRLRTNLVWSVRFNQNQITNDQPHLSSGL